MRLTIEDNREALKRYGHIKPAPAWGATPCSARCPGTVRNCTLRRGHAGPHVAHGSFRRVVAVWDKGMTAGEGKPIRRGAPFARPVSRAVGIAVTLRALRDRFLQRVPSMEEILFLILGLSMAGFAIHWMLLIFGG